MALSLPGGIILLCLSMGLDEPKKAPIPDAASQAASLKAVRSLHREDYANAKLPAQKSALAKRLLAAGKQASDDPSGAYVLFQEARDLAIEGGDPATAFQAIEEAAGRFLEVNVSRLKQESLEKFGRAALTPAASADLAYACFTLTSSALRAGNY